MAAVAADWITLDLSGLLTAGACHLLAGGFGLCAISYFAAAGAEGETGRRRRAR